MSEKSQSVAAATQQQESVPAAPQQLPSKLIDKITGAEYTDLFRLGSMGDSHVYIDLGHVIRTGDGWQGEMNSRLVMTSDLAVRLGMALIKSLEKKTVPAAPAPAPASSSPAASASAKASSTKVK